MHYFQGYVNLKKTLITITKNSTPLPCTNEKVKQHIQTSQKRNKKYFHKEYAVETKASHLYNTVL